MRRTCKRKTDAQDEIESVTTWDEKTRVLTFSVPKEKAEIIVEGCETYKEALTFLNYR